MRLIIEPWQQLCEQASTEQDPEKLLALVQEINHLLEAKQSRLKNENRADTSCNQIQQGANTE